MPQPLLGFDSILPVKHDAESVVKTRPRCMHAHARPNTERCCQLVLKALWHASRVHSLLKRARSRSRKLVKFPVVVKFPVAVAEVAECAETVKWSLLRTSPSRNLEWMGSWFSAILHLKPFGRPSAVPVKRHRGGEPDTNGSTGTGSRLGLRQHRLRGVQGGRRPPCSGCVVVSPASVGQWRSLGARSMLDARCSCALRSASPRPLRMPVSASRVLSSSGALAAPPAVAHLPRAPSLISPSTRAPPSSSSEARGGALGAGGGRVGFAGGGLF